MSDDTLVTAAEIARLANVGRAAVSNWRRRHSDFPEPVMGSGSSTAYRLGEVRTWLQSQGKLSGLRPEEALWRALEAGRGQADVVDLVADVATYLRDPDSVTLPESVRAELESVMDLAPSELLESLTSLVFERQQRQHLVTPPELAGLMMDLAGPTDGAVYDPACGPGNLLSSAMESGAKSLVGQEADEAMARLAQARLAEVTSEIASGDTLRADAFVDLQADVVVCDPPFGYRDWGHEELGVDPRWEYGFPAKSEPELAWAQHCLARVRPGGTVVLAMPAGVASRRAGRLIRQALVRRGALRAVVGLPAGVLMSTGIAIHLWVLRRPETERPEPVLLVDVGQHQPPRRGQVDWDAIRGDVTEAWQAFLAGDTSDVAGQRCVVEPIDLLDEEVDLTPARHLPQQLRRLDVAAWEQERAQLVELLKQVPDRFPNVEESEPPQRKKVTLGELAKVGALELLQQVGPLDTDEGGTGAPVLSGRDVVVGTAPSLRLNAGVERKQIGLEPGDLVVPMLASEDGHTRARVIADEGWVLGPNLQLIRVDGGQLDVWFVAGQIRSSGYLASSATASGVHRVDVRRIEIPVVDLERQRSFGAAFRQLDEAESALKQASKLGTRLVRELADGFADFTVTPIE